MFLHTILYMIILQTTFIHVYHLKDDIRFRLNGSPNSHIYAYALQRWPLSLASPYMCTSACPLCYGWSAAAPR